MAYEIDKIKSLQIGVQGENIARNIPIDMTSWVEELEAAGITGYQFHVLFQPYNDPNVYPMVSNYNAETKVLTWTVTAEATVTPGVGYAEVRAQEATTGLVKKTRVIPTSVEKSVSGIESDPPEVQEAWVTAVLNSAAAVLAASQGKQVKFEIDEDTGHLMLCYSDDEEVTAETEWTTVDLGAVNAYAMAVLAGYTGTAAQFEQYMADIANGASEAAASAAAAAASAADALQHTQSVIETWLEDHIDPETGYALDTSLSLSNAAAPANLVGNLKNAIVLRDAGTERYNYLLNPSFVQGGYSNGSLDSATTRIRSSSAISAQGVFMWNPVLYLPSGYQFNAVNADANGDPIGLWSNSWHNSGEALNVRHPKFYIMIRHSNNSDIIPGEMTAFPILIVDKSNADEIDGYTSLDAPEWSNTSINNDAVIANTIRLMSKVYSVTVGTKFRIKTHSDYYVNYYGLNSDGKVKHTDSSWNTSTDRVITAQQPYYRFLVRRSDNKDIFIPEGNAVHLFEEKPDYKHTFGKYAGKKISILGDSISTFGGDPSDDPRYSDGTYTYAGNRCRYPQNNLLLEVHQTYWMMLIDELKMTLGINDSWAGSRVTWDGTTESADIGADKYIASLTRIGHLDNNGTPDIILVNAGTNDIGANVTIGEFNTENPRNYTEQQIAALSVSTFYDAYRAMIIRLQYYYPNAQIIVLLPNYAGYTPLNQDNYCEAIKTVCDFFGVPFIDARTCGVNIFNRMTYLPDGTHYNAEGMKLLYMLVASAMLYTIT